MTLENGCDVETRFLEVLKNNPKGASQQILQQAFPTLSSSDLASLINKFLPQGKIDVLKKGQTLLYILKTQDGSKKPQGQSADVEEKLIYEAVKRAGNDGTTAKDLKFATNLPQPHITKMLKSMEAKRLVKSVVAVNKRKVFMLFDLKPSSVVTGGTFFNGQEFETEFVDVLADQCHRYLKQAKEVSEKLNDPIAQRHASFKSSNEICNYINGLKISKVELKLTDIENILESLIYDNKVEKSVSLSSYASKDIEAAAENYYRVKKALVESTAITRMPCGVCPVFRDCGKTREVSPSTCMYMKEWLDL